MRATTGLLVLDGIQPFTVSPSPTADPSRRPFSDHVGELRGRLLWCAVSILAGSCVGYSFRGALIHLLVSPLGGPLYYASPVGGFNLALQTSIFAGLILAIPVVVYHLLKFVQPILPSGSRGWIVTSVVTSSLLALLGAEFAYLVCLPSALHFLDQFSTGPVHSLISTDQYFSFISTYVAGFALVFQLPLIILFVNAVRPLEVRALVGLERWVVLASFVAAAFLNPAQDPLNQTLMALPVILLYNVSILLVLAANRQSRR